jgi:hypothetical protein
VCVCDECDRDDDLYVTHTQPAGDAGTFVFYNDRLLDACIQLADRPDVLYLRSGAYVYTVRAYVCLLGMCVHVCDPRVA